jgi:hypothetical protein
MAALSERESSDMRCDDKVVSVSFVTLGAVDKREVVQRHEGMSPERADRGLRDTLGEQGCGQVVRYSNGSVPTFLRESMAAEIGPYKLKACPKPALLVPAYRTAVDIVAAVEAADIGVQGGGERIVVVAHGLNGFVPAYYTTAALYPFIISKLFSQNRRYTSLADCSRAIPERFRVVLSIFV